MQTIRQKLEQYRSLKREVINLERRILDAQTKTVGSVDVIKMSDVYYPHIEHSSSVVGYCVDKEFLGGIVELYKSRLAQAKALLIEIEAFIHSVENSEMRELLTLRYIEGLPWWKVTQYLGSAGSGTTELQKAYRFLETIK